MIRPLAGILVALLALSAPLAAASADEPIPGAPRPTLPDLAPAARAIAAGAASAAAATGDALAGIASGALALAQAAGAALAALGTLLAGALSAIASALASLASTLGALLAGGARYAAAHPKESAIVAGATGAGLLGYATRASWLSVLVPLYSRLAKSDMLDNRVRASVYEHVRANPGAHPSRIADELDLGWGTVVYHLARLEESSLVTTRPGHNRKCYFAVGTDLDNAGRTAVAAMSTDKARAIVETLRASPGLSQKELAERLGMSQALASWHVKRLVGTGVLVTTRAGRANLLHVAEHVPVVQAAPAVLAA